MKKKSNWRGLFFYLRSNVHVYIYYVYSSLEFLGEIEIPWLLSLYDPFISYLFCETIGISNSFIYCSQLRKHIYFMLSFGEILRACVLFIFIIVTKLYFRCIRNFVSKISNIKNRIYLVGIKNCCSFKKF